MKVKYENGTYSYSGTAEEGEVFKPTWQCCCTIYDDEGNAVDTKFLDGGMRYVLEGGKLFVVIYKNTYTREGHSKEMIKIPFDQLVNQTNEEHCVAQTYDLYSSGEIHGCNDWVVQYHSSSGSEDHPCLSLEKKKNGNTFVMDLLHWANGKYCLALYLREEGKFSNVLTPIVEDKFPYDFNILNLLHTNSQRYITLPMMKDDLIILAKLIMGAI